MQAALFELPPGIVNVASVPQRSPFRYPGGKTWLVPRIRQWLTACHTKPTRLIEPFAGGGIVSLTCAFENLTNEVLLVELDAHVASVWKTMLDEGGAEWLAARIQTFDLNRDSLTAELEKAEVTIWEEGFRTLLRNRVNHGGILAAGSGALKHGENGKGILSRWYPDTLAKRILEIGRVRERLGFRQGNAFDVITEFSEDPRAAFFIDPPYTAAGKKAGTRLYTHFQVDHERLFYEASQVKGELLMTYDNAQGVIDLATKYGLDYEAIPMKNTHHAEMSELLIGKDLSWVRASIETVRFA